MHETLIRSDMPIRSAVFNSCSPKADGHVLLHQVSRGCEARCVTGSCRLERHERLVKVRRRQRARPAPPEMHHLEPQLKDKGRTKC